MPVPTLTQKDIQVLADAWACMKGEPLIDYDKLAQHIGSRDGNAAYKVLWNTKRKLKLIAAAASGGNSPASVVFGTPTPPARPPRTPRTRRNATTPGSKNASAGTPSAHKTHVNFDDDDDDDEDESDNDQPNGKGRLFDPYRTPTKRGVHGPGRGRDGNGNGNGNGNGHRQQVKSEGVKQEVKTVKQEVKGEGLLSMGIVIKKENEDDEYGRVNVLPRFRFQHAPGAGLSFQNRGGDAEVIHLDSDEDEDAKQHVHPNKRAGVDNGSRANAGRTGQPALKQPGAGALGDPFISFPGNAGAFVPFTGDDFKFGDDSKYGDESLPNWAALDTSHISAAARFASRFGEDAGMANEGIAGGYGSIDEKKISYKFDGIPDRDILDGHGVI